MDSVVSFHSFVRSPAAHTSLGNRIPYIEEGSGLEPQLRLPRVSRGRMGGRECVWEDYRPAVHSIRAGEKATRTYIQTEQARGEMGVEIFIFFHMLSAPLHVRCTFSAISVLMCAMCGHRWHNAEYQAFKQLLETDHVAFVAAGNSACDVDANSPNGVTSETCGQKGDQNSCCWTPGAYPLTGIINVGASTRTGAPAQFSCWGKFSVDVFGPGTDGIASLVTSGGRDSYAYVHGTSFAAPLVAGAVAYVWSSNPEATRDQVIAAVVSGVHKLPQLKDKATTEGIFDAFETLTAFKTILGSQQTKPASGAAGSSMAASTFCALLGATVSTILAGW
eukprot:GHVU01124910.1.p1 GENE.GHVU01124910.1~~GHVU01124910.1.p1  ORF type:complete len:334 (-),score=10.54 GHVU01124910.1:858-1859(-)